jgi:hypothetical protein
MLNLSRDDVGPFPEAKAPLSPDCWIAATLVKTISAGWHREVGRLSASPAQ